MSVFEISPLEAIGPLRLGVARTVARQTMAAIGFPPEHSQDSVDYFCESCMQVSHGPSDEISFIGRRWTRDRPRFEFTCNQDILISWSIPRSSAED